MDGQAPTWQRELLISIRWLCFIFVLLLVSRILETRAATPEQGWRPPETTGSHLRMRRLTPDGTSRFQDCEVGDTSYGCTAFCDDPAPYPCPDDVPVRPYPYSSAWPDISFNKDYLLDVLAQETSPGLFDPAALQVQAIAARSYAWYQINNSPYYVINNSSSFQVFLPFKFESFGSDPDNASDPCRSTNLSDEQTRLCQAVGTGSYYLSWEDESNPEHLPARANFFSDVLTHTTSSGDKAYLIGVEDPISNDNATCSASNSAAHSWGMSQEGAQRWATGDQCGTLHPDSDAPWSVRWTRPEQILFHYYTDVHLRDANKQVVTSRSAEKRWSPLKIVGELGSSSPVLWRGISHPTGVWVQNVGLDDWNCTGDVSDYHLRYRWSREGHAAVDGHSSGTLCGLTQGDAAWAYLMVSGIPDWGYGYYTVSLDVMVVTGDGEESFSPEWPTYDVRVFVFPTSLWGGYTSPADGAEVNYSVNLVAQAGGDGNSAGVDRVLFRANVGGSGWHTVAEDDTDCPIGQTCSYEATWSLFGIPDRTTVELGFDVVDKLGTFYYSPQGTRQIVIRDDPPVISFDTANGDSSSLIWSNRREWTFVGTASDPEGHLGSIEFHCNGDECGSLVSKRDGSNWSRTQDDLLGQVDIYFSVSDPALNVATSRHLDLRIDVATPTTTLTLNDALPTSWYSGTVQAQLEAADSNGGYVTSGVSGIVYRVDNEPAVTHAGNQVSLQVSGEGEHMLRFHAVDVAGNHEPTHTVGFGIDDTAPVAEDVTVVTGSGLGNCVIPSGTVWLDLSASDVGSGVGALRLSNDGISWSPWRAYATRVLWQLASVSEPSQVYFQVRDRVGWESAPISRTLLYAPPDVWCMYMPVVACK